MKKFKFSMQKVLEYKDNLLNSEKNILKEMRSDLASLRDEREYVYRIYEEKKYELAQKCTEGIQIKDIKVLQSYIAGIQAKINIVTDKIEKLTTEIEKQVEKVKNLSSDKTTIEKLREKDLESYKAAGRREEELFINEFINNLSKSKEVEV